MTVGFISAIITRVFTGLMRGGCVNIGELEKAALQYFWRYGAADAKQVHAHFAAIRGGSLNTIQSTLDRLFKKGLLKREKQRYAYVYRAAMSKEAFVGQLITDVTKDFFEPSENALAAAFSSMSSTLSDDELAELEALIEQQRSVGREE